MAASLPTGCRDRVAIGLTGVNANLIRLYGDQPLDRLHLPIHEQHVWNLNRLFVCAAGREGEVARAPPQDNVMEQILTTLLKDKLVCVETAGPTAHQALLDHLPWAHSPHGQPIKSKDGKEPDDQQRCREH
jgi:hypothetical protein